ncbi:MAG: Na+:solute symporter [Planctomycetes bacterium]|nr:Na+:solute symporter [Planctomycetota bacterium]
MTSIDWAVVACYGAFIVGVGLWQKRRVEGGLEDYFVSGRKLRWWVAGTSMIAASFASDTPLLVASYVRSKGIWGNWQWWGLGISTVLTIFFFAPLWRRSGVITEAELTEARYGGASAAGLRGFKALYWGLLYNCFQAGAWGITGLATVTTVMTGVDRTTAILACAGLGGLYAIVSGLWGVVAADAVQFVVAIGGSVVLAVVSVNAAGGLSEIAARVPAEQTTFLPLEGDGLLFCLAALLVQWWAWKNTDGGGVLVQRMVACRNEREAVYATLWFNVAHYAVRSWPWILVALASIVVIPAADPQAAYPLMIRDYLPAGLRGLIVAWFFAEFMASLAGSMNWGGSLLVNDFYRRFIKRDGSKRHYLRISRLSTVLVIAGAVVTAFLSSDLVAAFEKVLGGTAAVGFVFAARWLWWRINAWSEITAMIASPLMTFLVVPVLTALGWEFNPLTRLLFILAGSLLPVAVVTFATKPVPMQGLEAFYRKVRPPGPGWRPLSARYPDVRPSLSLGRILGFWAMGVAAIYSLMYGIGTALLLRPHGWVALGVGAGLLIWLVARLRRAEGWS